MYLIAARYAWPMRASLSSRPGRRRSQPALAARSSFLPEEEQQQEKEKKSRKKKDGEEKLSAEAEGLLATIESHRATGHPALLVAQTAPAVRVALSEEFGLEPGAFSPGQMVAALRSLGFDKIVDTNTAADLCVCEEGTELLQRLLEVEEEDEEEEERRGEKKKEHDDDDKNQHGRSPGPLPMFTSCCPGWIQLVEKTMPDLWPYVSSCKSPHMAGGDVVPTESTVLQHYSRIVHSSTGEHVFVDHIR